MKVLGITGGVGAGKSTVLDYLRETYSARVIQCDEAARELQEPGAPAISLWWSCLGSRRFCRTGS